MRKCRAELDRCGIPEVVLSSSRAWCVFLEHGYDHGTGWSPDLLSDEATAEFYDFLVREYVDERRDFSSTFLPLENRLGRVACLGKRVQARTPDAVVEVRRRSSADSALLVWHGERLFVVAFDRSQKAYGVGRAEDGAGCDVVNEFFSANLDDAGEHLCQLLDEGAEPPR